MKLTDEQLSRAAERIYAAWHNRSGNESDARALAEEFRNMGPARRNQLIFALREFAGEVVAMVRE